MMKKVFIKTYGCQMNERDSEAVAALLRERGYGIAGHETDADIILLNTCSVRDLAEQKALGKMTGLAYTKKRKPGLILGYMGCMAQNRGAELLQSPAVNLVVGTQKFHHIPEYLDQLVAGHAPVVDVAEEPGSESEVKHHTPGAVTAFVSIMQGCDMACTFCIVPATRGAERSRSIPEIVEEIQQLVATGVKEVTLLGQIVTSYGRKKSEFVKLLTAVNAIPGLERLRFTSPHPKGFGEDLVAAYRDLPKLCEHAHLPVQSGSNRILKAMQRGYTRETFLQIVEELRATRPGIVFSTDVIVGFPGETDEDFTQTTALLQEVEFDQAYIFKYSPRRDTPAATLPAQLPDAVKEARNQAALETVNTIILRKNSALIGQTLEVLVEGRSEKGAKRMLGRTRTNKIATFDGDEQLTGRLVPVTIGRATVAALHGTL